jgi:hypothetical protein
MNKQGVTPSIDNLAKLADEYVATSDKSAFAEKAVKMLGRGYQTLIPLLAKGGKALREQTDAIEDGLIATDESIKAAREYEVALDNLDDKLLAVKMSIGNQLLPVMVDFATKMDDSYRAAEELRYALDMGIITQEEYNRAFTRTGQIGMGVEQVLEDNRQAIDAFKTSITQAGDEQSYFNARLNETQIAAGMTAEEIEALAKAENEAANQTLNLAGTFTGLVANAEDFRSRQKDVSDELYETNRQIAELEGKSYLTGDQRQQLEDLKIKQQELQAEYRKNAEEHATATNKIIFDIQTQVLAMDGLTAAEAELLLASAEGMGLVDSASAEAARKILHVMEQVQSGAMDAEQAIRKVQEELNALKDKTIKIKIRYTSEGAVLPSGEIANAEGGHYIVPASAGQEGWHFSASGGERVDVWTRSELAQAQSAAGSMTAGERPDAQAQSAAGGKTGVGGESFVPWTNGRIILDNKLSAIGERPDGTRSELAQAQSAAGGMAGVDGGGGNMVYIANQTIIVGSGDPDEVIDAVAEGNLKSGASIGYAG